MRQAARPRSREPRSRRSAGVTVLVIAAAGLAVAVGPSLGLPGGSSTPTAPAVTVRIVPAAPHAGGAIAGTADRGRGLGTMAAFRDPDLVPKVRDA
ncbi:hypothetical protein [Agromyces sp. ZXT2-3]|uniref:hypothetical protein n=1 Tax=Agromyces sp. ZXT2-3 TaxID=3461152 RepID=UPI0040550564